jgi:pyroglutamyl-peptidase
LRTILVTGFGPFPGSPVNSSGLVALRVVSRRRPALIGIRRIAHVFATRYDAVDRELPVLLAREKPEIIVMFGVAARSRHVRIEERARNRIALLPDASGYRPPRYTIAPRRDALRNPLPFARLINAARAAGVAAAGSRNAGAYLCNYVYWRALEAAARPDGPGVVIFVHLPPFSLTKRPKGRIEKPHSKKKHLKNRPLRNGPRGNRRAARLDALVRAGEAIVLAMVSLAAAGAKLRRPMNGRQI